MNWEQMRAVLTYRAGNGRTVRYAERAGPKPVVGHAVGQSPAVPGNC